MALIGYVRVSTGGKNLDCQVNALVAAEIDKRHTYKEKITGTKLNREELDRTIHELELGDTVIITDLTRISRSIKDLLDIVDKIKGKEAAIRLLKDTWLDTTLENPYNDFLFTVMSGLLQLEKDLISQRTKIGLASARGRGRTGGRPSKQNEKEEMVKTLEDSGMGIVDIVKQTGLSRSTINRILKTR